MEELLQLLRFALVPLAEKYIIDPSASFEKVVKAGWRVAPVTGSLVYASDRVRPELGRWVDDVAKWDFAYISPAHFAAGRGTPADLRRAFGPVLAGARDPAYTAGDLRLLETLSAALKKLDVI